MDLKKGLLISGTIAILMIAVVVVAQGKNKQSKSLVPEESDPEYSKKFNFHLIPDGKGNYRSAQFTANELPYIIKKYNIKRIIRHNGDGDDSKHRSSYPETSMAKEKSICEANGCEYNFVPSHSGYKAGQGYSKSINDVSNILDKGNTLIHCAHGADRTGGIVGGYLKNRGYMTNLDQLWQYTTQYNGWQRMIKNKTFFGSGFDKYADGFYPISQLKNSKWVK
jgi:protein tyrosine/serine phosphatase